MRNEPQLNCTFIVQVLHITSTVRCCKPMHSLQVCILYTCSTSFIHIDQPEVKYTPIAADDSSIHKSHCKHQQSYKCRLVDTLNVLALCHVTNVSTNKAESIQRIYSASVKRRRQMRQKFRLEPLDTVKQTINTDTHTHSTTQSLGL